MMNFRHEAWSQDFLEQEYIPVSVALQDELMIIDG